MKKMFLQIPSGITSECLAKLVIQILKLREKYCSSEKSKKILQNACKILLSPDDTSVFLNEDFTDRFTQTNILSKKKVKIGSKSKNRKIKRLPLKKRGYEEHIKMKYKKIKWLKNILKKKQTVYKKSPNSTFTLSPTEYKHIQENIQVTEGVIENVGTGICLEDGLDGNQILESKSKCEESLTNKDPTNALILQQKITDNVLLNKNSDSQQSNLGIKISSLSEKIKRLMTLKKEQIVHEKSSNSHLTLSPNEYKDIQENRRLTESVIENAAMEINFEDGLNGNRTLESKSKSEELPTSKGTTNTLLLEQNIRENVPLTRNREAKLITSPQSEKHTSPYTEKSDYEKKELTNLGLKISNINDASSDINQNLAMKKSDYKKKELTKIFKIPQTLPVVQRKTRANPDNFSANSEMNNVHYRLRNTNMRRKIATIEKLQNLPSKSVRDLTKRKICSSQTNLKTELVQTRRAKQESRKLRHRPTDKRTNIMRDEVSKSQSKRKK